MSGYGSGCDLCDCIKRTQFAFSGDYADVGYLYTLPQALESIWTDEPFCYNGHYAGNDTGPNWVQEGTVQGECPGRNGVLQHADDEPYDLEEAVQHTRRECFDQS